MNERMILKMKYMRIMSIYTVSFIFTVESERRFNIIRQIPFTSYVLDHCLIV